MKTKPSVFHIIDLDRTLLDTSKLAERLRAIVAKNNADLALAIEREVEKYAQLTNSFFMFEYIAINAGHDALESYVEELNATTDVEDLLLPGAVNRMEFATSQPNWEMGILTYGSPHDQEIKLKLVGLDTKHRIITSTPKKGAIIASWKQPDGTYQLPDAFGGHTVDVLTFDDDKLVAFEDLPEDVLGQWITKSSMDSTFESDDLPGNVRAIADLESSIAYLKTKLITD